jgi:hypothetical protein
LTPTRFGNVVVFERYAPTGGTRQSVADSTLPNEVRMLFGGLFSSSLTEAAVAAIVDDTGCGHIGKRIEKFLASTS